MRESSGEGYCWRGDLLPFHFCDWWLAAFVWWFRYVVVTLDREVNRHTILIQYSPRWSNFVCNTRGKVNQAMISCDKMKKVRIKLPVAPSLSRPTKQPQMSAPLLCHAVPKGSIRRPTGGLRHTLIKTPKRGYAVNMLTANATVVTRRWKQQFSSGVASSHHNSAPTAWKTLFCIGASVLPVMGAMLKNDATICSWHCKLSTDASTGAICQTQIKVSPWRHYFLNRPRILYMLMGYNCVNPLELNL